jgi:hypothetical protein
VGKTNINYFAFLNSSGYSQAAQDYILALHKSNNYVIKITPIGGNPTRPSISDERYEILSKMITQEIPTNAIQIFHCIPTIQNRYPKSDKTLGFATFETFNPPMIWRPILQKNSGIITPSKFNFNIFAHMHLDKPIFYIPHCIDFEKYYPEIKPMYKYDKFTFLFMGTWKVRKGYQQLIEAWLREFSEQDNVQLMIKTDKIIQAKTYIDRIKKQIGNKGFSPIIFEPKVFDEKMLPTFIKSFDCLVIPTTGEGFCIPGLQSMSLKVPVIITDFSGCQDYANEKTSILLKPEGFVLHNSMDAIPQFGCKKWAFLSVKQIQEKMRYAINNKSILSSKADNAYNYVKENFNYSKIEQMFLETIRSL